MHPVVQSLVYNVDCGLYGFKSTIHVDDLSFTIQTTSNHGIHRIILPFRQCMNLIVFNKYGINITSQKYLMQTIRHRTQVNLQKSMTLMTQ